MKSWTLAIVLLAACAAAAQVTPQTTPKLEPDRNNAPAPTVTFTFELAQSQPAHYSIAVEAGGKAAYRSIGSLDQPGDPYILKFAVTDATRDRIFALAQQASFFNGDFAYKGNIANTGAKTLAFDNGDKHFQTAYNWSQNQAIQELTAIFQQISTTLEAGQRLDYLLRFEKLGIDGELKRLEEMVHDDQAGELQAIRPQLEAIAKDPSVMNVSRMRAQRLLSLADSEARATANGSHR